MMYLRESLKCFRNGNFLASTIMLGVASEKLLYRLIDAFKDALDSSRKSSFEQAIDKAKNSVKQKRTELWSRLEPNRKQFPDNLGEVAEDHLNVMAGLIARHRNEAGHPSGKEMDQNETNSLLLMFPYYCKTVHSLIAWLDTKPTLK